MKALLRITSCIWFIAMLFPATFAIREASLEEQVQLGAYQTVTLNINEGVNGYKTFMSNLRQKFESSTKACDLPVTRDTLPKGGEYVLVDLKNSNTEYVTVAIKVTDLYLIAFRVNKQTNGKYQAKFLDEPDKATAKSKLFTDSTTTQQVDLKYDSNYANIEKFAGSSRRKISLGIYELRNIIKKFYDDKKPITPAEEAQFLLIAIQMVSEAGRYSYIEDKVVNNGGNSFKPDDKMINLETSWQKISDAVRTAETKGNCKSQEVSDIKKDTKLLKYKRKKLSNNVFDDAFWYQQFQQTATVA